MIETTQQELTHTLDMLATSFEMFVAGRYGSDAQKIEDWREAFYQAFDNPGDKPSCEAADSALTALFK